MATYVYETNSGRLVSWNQGDEDQVASAEELVAKGLTAVTGHPVLDDTHVWHEESQSVVEVEAPAKPKYIDTFDFLLGFTPNEMQAMKTSQDPAIQQMVYALSVSPKIDLNHSVVKDFVGNLANKNIIKPDRVDVISKTGQVAVIEIPKGV